MVEYLNYRVLHPIMMVELVPKFTLKTKNKKRKMEKRERGVGSNVEGVFHWKNSGIKCWQ